MTSQVRWDRLFPCHLFLWCLILNDPGKWRRNESQSATQNVKRETLSSGGWSRVFRAIGILCGRRRWRRKRRSQGSLAVIAQAHPPPRGRGGSYRELAGVRYRQRGRLGARGAAKPPPVADEGGRAVSSGGRGKRRGNAPAQVFGGWIGVVALGRV